MTDIISFIRKKKKVIFYIFVILLFIATSIHMIVSLSKILQTNAPDFLGFREATLYLMRHKNPYSVNGLRLIIIPPISAMVFVPFLFNPVKFAQALFVLLNTAAVPLIVILSIKMVYKKISWYLVLLFTSLAYLSFPVKFTIGMGQTNLLVLCILLCGYYFFEKKRVVLSGILIATAFLVKPMLLFVIFFFIFKKAWKTLLSIIGALIIYTIIAGILFGVQVDIYYVFHVVPGLLGIVTAREIYYNQGLLGFVSRITSNLILRKYVTDVISFFLLGYTFYLLLKHKYSDNFLLSLFLTLVLIIHTLAWQHQFVFLIFPFIFLSKIVYDMRNYIMTILLLLAYFLVSWNFRNPHSFYHFPQSLVLSNQFYGAILLLVSLYLLQKNYKSVVSNGGKANILEIYEKIN